MSKEYFFKNPYWIFTLFMLLVYLLPTIVQDGMFLDGVTYATIARNMAEGSGTIWFPHYVGDASRTFHDHPPLGFFLESLLFRLIGDSIYVERLYTLLTAILTAFLIVTVWRTITRNYKTFGWIPVIFWIITPIVYWSYRNNMLENTMTIFCLLAVYAMVLHAYKQYSPVSTTLLLSLFVLFGLFTKGPVALFPLISPVLAALITKKIRLGTAVNISLMATVMVTIAILLLVIISDDAKLSLSMYWENQILASLSGRRDAHAEWYYTISILISHLSLMGGIGILIFFLHRRWGIERITSNYNCYKSGLLMLAIGASASLPISISPKQLEFYIVPSMPFFALGTALLIIPVLAFYLNRLKAVHFNLLNGISYLGLIGVITYSLLLAGKYSRDEQLLKDIKLIGNTIGEEKFIGISESLFPKWDYHAYFARYCDITLSTSGGYKYHITKGEDKVLNEKDYQKIEIDLNVLTLYKLTSQER